MAEVGSGATAARRVLVAEDDPVNQRVVLEMLRRLGYEAALAGNGREALAQFERGEFALVLMDCMMRSSMGSRRRRRCASGTRSGGCR
jgi:CheY-like chemotaxis protein